MSSALQVNLSYSKSEDRLLLKMPTAHGDQQYLWFTRLMTGFLMDILQGKNPTQPDQPLIPTDTASLPNQLAQEAMVQQSIHDTQFETRYEHEQAAKVAEILVVTMHCRLIPSGGMELIWEGEQGEQVKLPLDPAGMGGLWKAFDEVLSKTNWQLNQTYMPNHEVGHVRNSTAIQ